MKIKGKEVAALGVDYIVIPRPKENIVLKLGPVTDMSKFEDLVKRPNPPTVNMEDGEFEDTDDPIFLKEIREYSTKRFNWQLMHSLLYTDDLEFEGVDLDNPNTWDNFEKDFNKYFSDVERTVILNKFMLVNGLTTKLIEDATKDFLALMADEI